VVVARVEELVAIGIIVSLLCSSFTPTHPRSVTAPGAFKTGLRSNSADEGMCRGGVEVLSVYLPRKVLALRLMAVKSSSVRAMIGVRKRESSCRVNVETWAQEMRV